MSVCPCIPFNLLFLPEIYGLEQGIPTGRLTQVLGCDGGWWEKTVRLTFPEEDGRGGSLEPRLRHRGAFLATVGSVRDQAV